jgi:hypothetical protein
MLNHGIQQAERKQARSAVFLLLHRVLLLVLLLTRVTCAAQMLSATLIPHTYTHVTTHMTQLHSQASAAAAAANACLVRELYPIDQSRRHTGVHERRAGARRLFN